MSLWVKIGVEILTDPKLASRPPWQFKLWVGLLCLCKQHAPDGKLDGYTSAGLASSLNLGVSAVKVSEALQSFATAGMVELPADPIIHLPKFRAWQADPTAADRKRRSRSCHGPERDIPESERDKSVPVTLLEEDPDPDPEKAKDSEPAAKAAADSRLVGLESGWPKDLLARVKSAVTSTRSTGQMAERPWLAFLLRASRYSAEIRQRAAEEYLDKAHDTAGKGEKYLLGIMAGEKKRAQQGLPISQSRKPGFVALVGTTKRFEGLDDGDPLGLNLQKPGGSK